MIDDQISKLEEKIKKLEEVGDLIKNKGILQNEMANTDRIQILSNKALKTPTIDDFTNATHAHSGTSTGGVIASATNAFSATNALSATNSLSATSALSATNSLSASDSDKVDGLHASEISGSGIVVGAILTYGGSASPAGYLMCDGAAVSRTTYSALSAVIGTIYGSGDGSTTFNVPDLQQRFPLGKATSGTGSVLGSAGGAINHTHTGPSHAHVVSRDGWGNSGGALAGRLLVDTGVSSEDKAGNNINTAASGTAETGLNNPPFLTINYIIKT